ncbi:phosphatase PAP2 family protein [Winogradskyella flava]|uniref:phosphatase PAP2 family protein n=1 Tax=Winogradskyella flava TaxID=1884876 RepID=UPI0024905864|nr:phosphatase PAP2 family protein [Winogradskyella flava]
MKIYSILFALIFTINLTSQNDSIRRSNESKFLKKKLIIPSILTGAAFLLTKSDFEISLQNKLQKRLNNNFSTKIDGYTRYAPILQMYTADLLGAEAKNHWFDQSRNMALSLLITKYTTAVFKGIIVKERPNLQNNNAFPSGHTSAAFASATVLYEEFKDTSPLLAYSGYIFASSTAYLRMANNAHWFSDVLAGAALGIAITKLVYHFDYLFDWNPFKNNEGLIVLPSFTNQTVGLTGILRF